MLPSLWLLAGCAGDIGDVAVEVDPDIATVLHVRFSTDRSARGWVEYGQDDRYGQRTALGPEGKDHDIALLGLTTLSALHLRARATTDDADEQSEDVQATAGQVPGDVPTFATVLPGEGPGYALTSIIDGEEGDSVVLIVDDDGRPTWYLRPDWGFTPAARFSRDGQSVLYLVTSKDHVEEAVIRRQPLSGGAYEEIPAPMAHHDFVELAGGRLAWIAAEVREVDGEAVVGDTIVVMDPDGTTRTLWDAFDWLPVEKNAGWTTNQYPFGVDWTHANGLYHDETTDAWLISLYYLHTVVRVDGRTGQTSWFFGGEVSDFSVPVAFGPQHAPSFAPDGTLTFFDNGGDENGSRAISFALDEEQRTAEVAWSHQPGDGRRTLLLGDVERLADGSAMVAWGQEGQLTRVGPDGAALWEVDCADVGVLGKVQQRRDLYR